MRRYIKNIIVLLIIIFAFLPISYIYADIEIEEFLENEVIDEIKEVSAQTSNDISINSRAAVVIDRNTHKILYGKNQDVPRPMASTTKICTCIVVLENANLKEIVKVSKKAAGTGGSRLGLKYNDEISVNDLLYGLMLCSR